MHIRVMLGKNHSHRSILRVALLAMGALTAVLLTGCAGGGGRYGPGAGHFNTVIVDAGHGGYDTGARSVKGSREKILALDTSKRLAAILRRKGFHVIETRTGDYFVPLPKRVDVSNRSSSSIFVSVHYNWSRRAGAGGMEVFYHTPKSRRLAANVLREMLRAYPAENRGIKTARFHVLRNNRRPAILCELGFLSNARDNRYVQNASTRQRLAEKIAAGIVAEREGRTP
jgi:N-acetylmuramoyl-L-alanine amidase